MPQRNLGRLGLRRLKLATTDTISWLGRQEEARSEAKPTERWDSPPVEIAAFDSKSIRMIAPGLPVLMGLMVPHWGRQVTSPQAFGAITTVAFMLLVLMWVTLNFLSFRRFTLAPRAARPHFPIHG